ncbi:hypothetical protein HII17_08095 [Thalassotalea sp. M1531]|uniref:Uncharacterized protein n=1 Tax=Thalassotalea algicola TaxID=2716224 RepID=A0A7Y0Q7Y6_9GAMM|nr:Imm26 family immunity protein [Thalassotalea algicola]NMP31520.1 hypothetical protein [Thalassotalea algicola]
MPRQKIKVGDVFWVPIEDGSFVLGQIVEEQKEVLNSITCVFFDCRVSSIIDAELRFDIPISCQFVSRELFNSGKWKRIDNLPNQIEYTFLPYRETEDNGWIGASVVGSANITSFLAAFYGLREWDEMYNPSYYQALLLSGVARRHYDNKGIN